MQSQHMPKSGLVTMLDHSNANKTQQTALHAKLTSTNSEHGMHQIVFKEDENDSTTIRMSSIDISSKSTSDKPILRL